MSSSLLMAIDCRREYAASEYFAMGATRVVNSPIGAYREAEGKPLSRFGYRFQIKHVGWPHLAIIRYPDDQRRFMIINDGTSYDLSTGVTTGHAYPVSGLMCELRQVFWPRWTDCSICFMTWGHGEPAAVASIEIQELADGLPPLILPPGGAVAGRELGIQYEDPCGTGVSEGAATFGEWLDHVVTYARHTGQNLLAYPICWYHGPWYPSRRERADAFSMVVAPDRKQYVAWTDDPPDWPAALLERFEQEGLAFQGVLTLLRLSSLMAKANTDLKAIQAGADTINNLLWNDQVQAGTMDWTAIYNTLNYPKLLARPTALGNLAEVSWAYGEKTGAQLAPGQGYHAGPMFNPLHPVVQEAVIGLVREIAERYGHSPAFKGVAITMWAPTLIWFGSIHSGYDDYSVGLFEKETGIQVPVDAKAPDRFSRRYEFLTYNCRPAWVAWRCRCIHTLVCRMRDAMTQIRPDLRLTLNLWSEPFVPCVIGSGQAQHQLGARPSTYDLYRDAGLDMNLFAAEPNLELDLQTEGGGRDRTPGNSEAAPLENFFMFRDHDFLDGKTLGATAQQRRPGAFIFNAWHEAFGEHKWFPADPKDPNLPGIATIYGQPNAQIFRINSDYPTDGFWWDSQLRITAAYPPPPHFMEPYAHALAELDACRITRGGLFLDKCHGEEIRRFALAFRALPAEKFDTVGGSTDPVTVRTLVTGGRRYLYLVNRDYYPVEVDLVFAQAPGPLTDLATGAAIPGATHMTLSLAPYELRSLALAPEAAVPEFTVRSPPAIISGLTAQADAALAAIRRAHASGRFILGAEELATGMQASMNEKRWAWLRHALTSYPVCKCLAIAR
jgi:hypothetical protein